MNRTLFAKEVKSSLFVASIVAATLVMYIAVVVAMFDPELGASLDMMMESMPELFAAFGMATQSSTLIEFLINYLYGFLLALFPLVLILIMVNKLVVRYIDRGTMSYLLATPNSRATIIVTVAAVLVAVLALVMIVVTASEIVSSEAMFPSELDMAALARANVGLFGLWVFMAGLCFLSACLFSHAGLALWAGGGLCILSYFLQVVSQIGEKFEFLKYATPLTLLDSYGLAAGEASAVGGVVALYAMGCVFFAVAVAVFCRRDLAI